MLLHLGSMHPIETALLLLVAVGPFVVMAVVVVRIRRRDAEDDPEDDPESDDLAEQANERAQRRMDS